MSKTGELFQRMLVTAMLSMLFVAIGGGGIALVVWAWENVGQLIFPYTIGLVIIVYGAWALAGKLLK